MTYPEHREADVVLRDGSTIHVRPVRPDDADRLLAFFRTLSDASRTRRFFSPATDGFLSTEARRQTAVDYTKISGLVATTGTGERVVGHAIYVTQDPERAEVAFAIADDHQGRGLGTILLGHLAELASSAGVRVFEAQVLPENHQMVDVFRQSGFGVKVRAEPGLLQITLPTSLTGEALERFEQRERTGAANALRRFFEPRAVAVIGASRRRASIGGALFHNLLQDQYTGVVYPVNPATSVVQGVAAYPSVEAIAGPVDLAIIAVPADQVIPAVEQCARKGVFALVIISAGFAETGEEGRRKQAEMMRICRAAGMRVIGPNCMGILNTDPEVRLNATFAPVSPPPGRIGFLSQSGALGLAVIDHARTLGLGISTFVSVGNKADISGNDLITYWESDPRTDVILLYLESFGNPVKFSRIARRVGREKPIVAVKSGRSHAGARATSSHTGALVAASDIPVDALFRQTGVIRTDTLETLYDVASLLTNQPLPAGRRVGIITNAGGPAILCADACEAEGLAIPLLAEASQQRLREFLPAQASVGNPVDMIASATGEHYRRAIRVVGEDPNVDAVVAIFIPPLVTQAEAVAQAIVDGARDLARAKPLLTVFMSARGVPEVLRSPDVRVPSYAFPEAAAIALAHVARYAEWRRRPVETPVDLGRLRRDEAVAVVAEALGHGEGWLAPEQARALLTCYGLPVIDQRVVTDPAAAAAAAAEFGTEVALKGVGPGIVHKTEVGAVRLGLRGEDTVRRAAEEMREAVAAHGLRVERWTVQPMVPEGVEMIVGVVQDPQFGPMVACGAGGVMVEVLRDVAVRLAPLTRTDAAEMMQDLKTFPLLTGFRGRPACNVGALQDALLRVSALVEDLPQVAELDCNPIIVHPDGAAIVDVRVRVAPSAPPRPLGARH